jgi:hypothetical protein
MKVVGAGMVNGDGHDKQVAVDEVEGYTGDISWTVRLRLEKWKNNARQGSSDWALKGRNNPA